MEREGPLQHRKWDKVEIDDNYWFIKVLLFLALFSMMITMDHT